jgi:putative addiction module component (TIGR02574 family)
MDANIAKLTEEALDLPPEARGALASRLLESLHVDQTDPDAEGAWDAVISRRLQELDSGAVKTVPWSEARQQILRSM